MPALLNKIIGDAASAHFKHLSAAERHAEMIAAPLMIGKGVRADWRCLTQ